MSRIKVARRGSRIYVEFLGISMASGWDGKNSLRWREKFMTNEKDKLVIWLPRNPSHTFKAKAGGGAPELI